MIKEFITGKGDIAKHAKTDSAFLRYINKNNKTVLTQKIDNPYVGFDGFQKKGFTLGRADEKFESVLSDYTLYSKTKNTSISVWLTQIYGKKKIHSNIDLEKLKETYGTVVEKKNITLGGKQINRMLALIGEKKSDGTIDKNIVSLYFGLSNGMNYQIETANYGAEKKALNSAISLFVKNLQIKKELPLIEKSAYSNVPVSFEIIPDMNMVKSFTKMSFVFDSSTIQNGTLVMSKFFDGE